MPRWPPPQESDPPSRLARHLGTFDAVIIGLGAMVGAGIFAAIGPASAAAGGGLLIGLALAAAVAACNATSSAQLAALYPRSGGTYVYGRERLGHLWGFVAGWGFVIGKTASCAAMALTFGAYASEDLARPLAVGAVVVLTAVNLRGIRSTATLTKLIVALVLACLATTVVAATTADPSWSRVGPLTDGGLAGILQAAGFLFFAFAGYARIATLGEEVRDPARAIPRAIAIALTITLALYAAVAVMALMAVGPDVLAAGPAPLAAVARAGDLAWAVPLTRVGAVVASLGVLLSLLAGVGRTAFSMASEGDLPRWLSAVDARRRVPQRAELAITVVVIAIVLAADVRDAIGFSAFAVLVYYAIANASAWTLGLQERRAPRAVAVAGVLGCIVIAFSLPATSVIAGAAVLLVGAACWATIVTIVRRNRR
jgi:APA family basic amino acid/polyamine antiporter